MTQVTIPIGLGGSGISYSDDGTGVRDMRDGAFRANLLPMHGELIAAVQTGVNAAGNAVGGAATQATSVTSLTVGLGSRSLTVQTAKNFVVGMPVRIANSASIWMDGIVTAYTTGTGALVVNVTLISGSGTLAAWSVFLAGQPGVSADFLRSARTANTILAAGDFSSYIDVTANTFTQTFTAAATLAAGWYCIVGNSGTGDLTLDPNASETIDGETTIFMYPGEVRWIFCSGTAFFSIILQAFRREFFTSGTFTKPPGYRAFGGHAWGAGGAGAKANGTGTFASGGSGGACVPFLFPAGTLGASETITIAAAAVAQTVSNTAGASGGNSTFGSLLTAFGGQGGLTSGVVGGAGIFASGSGSSGGAPQGGASNTASSFGGGGGGTSGDTVYGGGGSSLNTQAGRSLYGGGGGAGMDSSNVLGTAGGSVFGGAGGASSLAGNGTAGGVRGGGGGSTQSGANSGAGGRGQIDIWGIF